MHFYRNLHNNYERPLKKEKKTLTSNMKKKTHTRKYVGLLYREANNYFSFEV